MEKDSHNTFKIGYSLSDLKVRFDNKNKQIKIGEVNG